MKTILRISLSLAMACFGAFNSAAQNVKYTVLQDDPQNYIPKLNVNIEFMQMDAAFNNIMGMSFNAGVFGVAQATKKIGIHYGVRKSYLSFAKMGNKDAKGNLDLTAGVFFLPLQRSKTKNLQVNLKSKTSYNNSGNRVETTTFIKVPGTVLKSKGLRAGTFYKSTGFDLSSVLEANDSKLEFANFNTTGIYAGLMSRKLVNLICDVDGYGKRFNSIGDEFYLDATLNIISNFNRLPNNPFASNSEYNKFVKDNVKSSPIGFRLGWTRYQIAPKSVTNKKFGSSASFEAGYRPYQGWYVTGSIGLTLIKK